MKHTPKTTKRATKAPKLEAVPAAPTTTPRTMVIDRSTIVRAIVPGALEGDENAGAVARLSLAYAADELEVITEAFEQIFSAGGDPYPLIPNMLYRLMHRLRAAEDVSHALNRAEPAPASAAAE